jgi:large subunit GTPase 1
MEVKTFYKHFRVIERSDILIQIVDCRNPILFRSEDLEKYILETGKDKLNILILNKADLLTDKQRYLKKNKKRNKWAKYYKTLKVECLFFSTIIETDEREVNFDAEEYTKPNEENLAHIYTREELIEYILHLKKTNFSEKKRIEVGTVGYPNVGKSR